MRIKGANTGKAVASAPTKYSNYTTYHYPDILKKLPFTGHPIKF